MKNSEHDFLHKLSGAKTEDEKTWLTTKRLIDSLPDDLQTLVYSAAIPHWFDARTLRVLNPELGRRINGLYSKLQKLPFVEPFEGRGHNIHELTRRLILDYLWKKQRRLYRSESQVLAKFYDDSSRLARKKIARKIKELEKIKDKKKSRREIQQWAKKNPEILNAVSSDFQIEYAYHLVIAQPKGGADNIRDMGWRWHDKFDYSFAELNALFDSIGEHIIAGRTKGRVIGWEKFFRGLLCSYRYDYINATTYFLDVISENYPDQKLNADVRFRLGDVHIRLSELPEARARYEEALPLYRAISNKLGEANCISSLGDVHMRLSELPEARAHYEEAEAAYRKAIELNPSDDIAYSNLGLLLHENLKRYDEAEAAYRKAIELNPSYAKAYNNLVILLRLIGREKETIPLLEKIIKISPEDFNPYLALASMEKQAGRKVSKEYAEKARQFLPEDDLYNRACLESVCDNFDLAFEYLEKAAQLERFNPSWAWEDPDLQWIRNDPRFTKIVGAKPK
ncbi:MAG: tetratricopeptide repeat protein [Anaerolineales bacterium]|nr:tetratricopeptide repeat protein [Anaerolineales bacterium]